MMTTLRLPIPRLWSAWISLKETKRPIMVRTRISPKANVSVTREIFSGSTRNSTAAWIRLSQP